ncbi:MAG: hypothetical protein COV10_00350 [Candidatus Vogelbacteria bacterium CG10_big_fil_rev_8_21_14_0_10_51_16]|uniref:Transcription regulator TrmB N-terminal domain-containing protein n=1 Tax=Candidatus Vogelbacteria bacterium CG10_big_fil_rev_8_21_14_0_10_51_16 TaxID=1975045 RepID=A0A2H0RGT8_9BACT|nr:MAG: hypothetical protein COV10_00350 [Candidatus Vogelbacteria bacterium CG10_big_fil_rev_8_21_14_0_10_51_16]
MKHKKGLFPLLGMTTRDEQIYTVLLALGPATATELAHRAKLHRQELYRALPSLLGSGVVVQVKRSKRRAYTACDPKQLLHLYEEARASVEEQLQEFSELSHGIATRPLVTYAEGLAGIRRAYADVMHSLPRGGIYFRYSSKDARRRAEKDSPRDFVQVRDKKQLERLVITNEEEKKRKRNLLGRDIRVVPKDFDLFEDNVTQVIYGNKVAIMDFNSETTITIENATIARFQEKIFRLLFRYLK